MKGFVQIPLLILLLVGTGASVYLIQQKTHFLPQAFSGKEILNLFSDQPIASDSSTQTFTYQLPTPTPVKHSNTPFLSAFQRLLQRKLSQSPAPTPLAKINTSPSPTPIQISFLASFPSPTVYPSATPNQNNPTSISNPKPVCSVLVMPSSTGTAPYQASVCVGNNSNPYQSVQQELVDYDGNGSWDYQGQSFGCHSFIFQNPGTYYPKAKIIGISGQESDICQTSATISTANPVPTPSPTPKSKIAAVSCSSVTVEGDVTYRSTYTDQDGYQVKIYFINSGGTAKLTAQTNPPGAYINWKIVNTSMYLPSGGTLTPDPNDYTVVTFTAPNNPTNEDQGTYVRGDYSDNPWKPCPYVDFAVKPG